jgi:DNA-binding IclR family transcriptional regulator
VVSIWGPDDRVDPVRFDELGAKAQSAAARIAAALRDERGGEGRLASGS